MKNIIHKNVVLVLNKNWQAIATTTPANAFAQMATDAATRMISALVQLTDLSACLLW